MKSRQTGILTSLIPRSGIPALSNLIFIFSDENLDMVAGNEGSSHCKGDDWVCFCAVDRPAGDGVISRIRLAYPVLQQVKTAIWSSFSGGGP